MILLLKMAALVFVAGALSLALKKDQPVFSFLISICAAAGLFAALLGRVTPMIAWLQALQNYTGGQTLSCLVRVLGIALVAQFASDTCRDAGLNAAATSAELCGRVLALLQALPMVQSLLDSFLYFLQ